MIIKAFPYSYYNNEPNQFPPPPFFEFIHKFLVNLIASHSESKIRMKYFRVQSLSFEAMGTFLIRRKNTKLRRLQSLINLVLFPWNLIPLANSVVHNYPNLIKMSDHVTFIVGILMYVCKLYSLHFRRRKFEQLYDLVLALDGKVNLLEREIVVEYVKFAQKFAIINTLFLNSSNVVFLVLPLAVPIYQYFVGFENIYWPSPVNYVYPSDIFDKSPVYEINFAFVTYTILQICIVGNAVDAVFMESCLITAGHFKVL